MMKPLTTQGYSKQEVSTAQRVIDLKARKIHPDGSFGASKRWYPTTETESSLVIRDPSCAYPFSKLAHCRTAKYNCQLDGVDLKRVNRIIKILKDDT